MRRPPSLIDVIKGADIAAFQAYIAGHSNWLEKTTSNSHRSGFFQLVAEASDSVDFFEAVLTAYAAAKDITKKAVIADKERENPLMGAAEKSCSSGRASCKALWFFF
jgi:hypothetical protein